MKDIQFVPFILSHEIKFIEKKRLLWILARVEGSSEIDVKRNIIVNPHAIQFSHAISDDHEKNILTPSFFFENFNALYFTISRRDQKSIELNDSFFQRKNIFYSNDFFSVACENHDDTSNKKTSEFKVAQ
jgi:hypothetical protein